MVDCGDEWLSYNGHCYTVNMQRLDYYESRRWCKNQGAQLVSINDANEDKFIYRICHNEPNPITYPKSTTRTTCWLGLFEKPGTGTVSTPQLQQIWNWIDGSSLQTNNYTNWAVWPGLGDGEMDGNRYSEPNNQRTGKSVGFNVRHAVMNQAEGGFKGYWYDKPASTRAHAVCEKIPPAV